MPGINNASMNLLFIFCVFCVIMTAEVIAVRENHIRSLCRVPKAELVYEAPDGSLMAYPIRAASGRASRSSRT